MDDSAEILFQSFLLEAIVSSSGTGRDVHLGDVHSAFPLPTTASPTLQGDPKTDFREAVVESAQEALKKIYHRQGCDVRDGASYNHPSHTSKPS